MSIKTVSLLLLLNCWLLACAHALVENFDESGTTWANTIFPVIIPYGGGAFERQALSAAIGAPNTNPSLPINSGGDLEGRYYEQTLATSSSYAVTTNSFTDATIDGYFGFGAVTRFGVPSMGFVIRESGASSNLVNGYSAVITIGGGISPYSSSGTLNISRIVNGIITVSTVLASSLTFGINEATENYHLTFGAVGSTLTASVSRVQVIGGTLVETPIDLLSNSGVQSSITATDSSLTSGAVGMVAFVRGSQSILFDDISIVVPEPCASAMLGLTCVTYVLSRRRRAAGSVGKISNRK